MRMLITNGTVIDTEPEPHVLPGAEVLVEDGVIAAVGRDLGVDDAEILDATGRIVLPGFVDTHRHVWQSALRSIAADTTLGDYLGLVLGRLAPAFRAEDVYAANLWGRSRRSTPVSPRSTTGRTSSSPPSTPTPRSTPCASRGPGASSATRIRPPKRPYAGRTRYGESPRSACPAS